MKEMYFMVKFTQRIPRTVAKILFLLLFLIMAVLVLRVYEFIRLSRYNFQQYKKEQQTVFNRLLIDEPPEKLKSFLKCHKNRKILRKIITYDSLMAVIDTPLKLALLLKYASFPETLLQNIIIHARNEKSIDLLLRSGVNPNFRYVDQWHGTTQSLLACFLMFSASESPPTESPSIVRLLLSHGASIDLGITKKGIPGEITPVMYAAMSGQKESLEVLLSYHPKTQITFQGKTAVEWSQEALKQSKDPQQKADIVKCIKLITQYEKNHSAPKINQNEAKTYFCQLFWNNDLNRLKSYIEQQKISYQKIKDYLQDDPLLLAFVKDDFPLIEYLVKNFKNEFPQNINYLCHVFESTNNNEKIIDLLLKIGYSPRVPEIVHMGPLVIRYTYPAYCIVALGSTLPSCKIIRILDIYKKHGADFNLGEFYVKANPDANVPAAVDFSSTGIIDSRSILWLAALNKNTCLVDYLINQQVSLDIPVQKKTILEWVTAWSQKNAKKIKGIDNSGDIFGIPRYDSDDYHKYQQDVVLYDQIISRLREAIKKPSD